MTGFKWAIVLLVFVARACADDALLVAIRQTAVAMRGPHTYPVVVRGATPQLTALKHQLRDWVESRLGELKWGGDADGLARKLNKELGDAKLFCNGQDCLEQNFLGFLGPVRLSWKPGFLAVETGVGVLCGDDESVYLYDLREERWKRRLESEQNVYTEKEYVPQNIEAVLTSGPDKDGNSLALILGTQPWCASNWRDVYYRLWRIGPRDPAPKLLLQESASAFLSSVPIQGTVGNDDVLIEFTVGSIDGATSFSYETIRHYKVRGDKVERVDPVALSPRDFVDDWYSNHRNKAERPYIEFIVPTTHCPTSPDLWQVGMHVSPLSGTPGKDHDEYFVVRWRPPYHFTMVETRYRPRPGCTEEDPEADERRTLFPR